MLQIGSNKKNLIMGVNFGTKSNRARILIERWLKFNPKNKFSQYIRHLVERDLVKNRKYGDWQTMRLLQEKADIEAVIKIQSDKLADVYSELSKHGVNVYEMD